MKAEIKSRKVEVTLTLEGVEPVKPRWKTNRVIPDGCVITYRDGGWSSMSYSGPIERKDGTPGESRSSGDWSPEWKSGAYPDAMPEWARLLTVEHRP